MAGQNLSARIRIGASLGASIASTFGSLGNRIRTQQTSLTQLRAAYRYAGRGVGEYAGRLDELGASIARAEARLNRLRAAARINIGASFKGVGDAFMGDAKRIAAGAGIIGAAAVGVSVSILKITNSFVDWADNIGDSAEALGISTQALQTWQYAASTVGVDAEKMTGTIAKFNKSIADGAEGTKETLKELGIDFETFSKLSLDDKLTEYAEAFKNYKGAGNKAAIMMQLMGKSGYKLTGVLSQGKDGFDKLRKAGEATGAVLDGRATKAVDGASRALDNLKISTIGIRNKIAVSFTPTLERLSDKVSDFANKNGPLISEWTDKFGKLIENEVVPAIGKILLKLPGVVAEVSRLAEKIRLGIIEVKSLVGGWANLGAILLAINFTPTIIAVTTLTVNLVRMGYALAGMTGPIGAVVVAIGVMGVALYDLNQENSRVYSWLTDMFPEAMRSLEDSLASTGSKLEAWFKKGLADGDNFRAGVGEMFSAVKRFATECADGMKAVFTAFFDWIVGKFDVIGTRITEMWQKAKDLGSSIGNFFGVTTPATPSNLTSQLAPPESMPSSSSQTAQNNTINLNVSAPGADGAQIARDVRTALTRKPLFDSDGALLPA